MTAHAKTAEQEVLRYMSTVSAQRAEQAIEELQRAGAEGNSAANRRREPREPFSAQVTIRAKVETAKFGIGGKRREILLEVFARNLSTSGFGFLVPQLYLPDDAASDAIAVRGEDVFAVGRIVHVALIRGDWRSQWLKARVVRSRRVKDGFVECGVQFV